MNFYKPIDVEKNTFKDDAEKLSRVCESLISNKSIISAQTRTPLTPVDIIKVRNEISTDKLGGAFKNIILNSIINAFEGGNTLRSHMTAWVSAIAILESDWNCNLTNISSFSRRATREELFDIIEKYCNVDECLNIFKKAILMAGSDSSISIEESKFEKTRIIQSSGFKMPFTLPQEFWRAVVKKRIEVLDPKIALIDGTITTVGEIHGILNQSHESGTPVLIFARGFGEEVIGTLIQNYRMGKLKVFPVVLPLGPVSNIIYDFCDLIDGDIVSVVNGAKVSSIKLENLNSIPMARMDQQNLLVFLENKHNAANIIKKLREEFRDITKKHDDYSKDIEQSYRIRLNFLTNKRVEILIGKNAESPQGMLKDRLQTMFSIYNEIVETGIIDLDNLKNVIPKVLYNKLCKFGIKYVPSASFCFAVSTATANRNLLLGTKKILMIDT